MPAPLGQQKQPRANDTRQRTIDAAQQHINSAPPSTIERRQPMPSAVPSKGRTEIGLANTMYAPSNSATSPARTNAPPPLPQSVGKRTRMGIGSDQKPPPPNRGKVVSLHQQPSSFHSSVPGYTPDSRATVLDSSELESVCEPFPQQPAIHRLPQGESPMLEPRRVLSSNAPQEPGLRSDAIAAQLTASAQRTVQPTRSTTPPPGRRVLSETHFDDPPTVMRDPKAGRQTHWDPSDDAPTRHFPGALPPPGSKPAVPPSIANATSANMQVPPPVPGMRSVQPTLFPQYGAGGKPPPVLNPSTIPPQGTDAHSAPSAHIQQARRLTGANLNEAFRELHTCDLDGLPRIAEVLASKPKTVLECYQTLVHLQKALLKTEIPKAAEKLREAIMKVEGKLEVLETMTQQAPAPEVTLPPQAIEAPRTSTTAPSNASPKVKRTGTIPVWIANVMAPSVITISLIISEVLPNLQAAMIGFVVFVILALYTAIKEKASLPSSNTPAKKFGYALLMIGLSVAIGICIPVGKKVVKHLLPSASSDNIAQPTQPQAKPVPSTKIVNPAEE